MTDKDTNDDKETNLPNRRSPHMTRSKSQIGEKDEISSVKTAKRTLDVFEVFARIGKPMSLTELAEEIHAPLSSCHALMKTLQSRGYFYMVDKRSFYPSKRMFDIATEIARQDPLLQRLIKVMTELRDMTGETIILGKRSGDEVIYLEVIVGTHLISYRERAGATKPLHSSAIGKAILGSLDERALKAVLGRLPLVRMTERTIVNRDKLQKDLKASIARGYFKTEGENAAEVQAISISFRLSDELLSLAIAGPIERMKRNEAHYAKLLREEVALNEDASNPTT